MDIKQKILIVDDRLENLYACEKILSEVDAEIIKATDGNDALRASLYNDFALAILDVKMPKMDGYELAEFIRNEDKTRDLPIIFLSAVYTDESHIFKGYESGAVDFITKPYNPKLLLNKVKVFLSLDRQKKRLEELVGEMKKTNEQLNNEIAERKRAEEALKRAEQEKEAILDSLLEHVVYHDMKMRVLWANRAACESVGTTREELVGRHCYEIWAERYSPCEDCPVAEAWETGHPQAVEKTTSNGRSWYIQGYPVRDGNGDILGMVELTLEITERKRAEEALRRSRNELERRVEERTTDLVIANKQLRIEIEERMRSEAALRKSESQLRFLSSELISAQENERKRISRELHDSIGSSLTAIKFRLDNILRQSDHYKAGPNVEPLETIMLMVRQTMQEVRRLQSDLRPSLLDDLGIVATISWFCEEFEKLYSGIHVEKHMNIGEKDVPEPMKVVIFRVLQEASNNVAKYAKADLMRISLRAIDGKIELAIEDNGVGFDVEHVRSVKNSRGGFGLTSMKERTELSGGAFSIESNKGEGTIVRASWQC